MIQTNGKHFRGLALLTGGVLAASALFHPAAARNREPGNYPREKDNSTAYKTGAAVLGAASIYMILKGKTLPGVAAAAGAYLAYKEGRKDDRDSNQYPQYPGYPGYNQSSSYPNNSYPNNYPSNGYPDYSNNYPSNSYPAYNSPTNYPSGGYGGQNNSSTYNGGYNQYPNDYRAVAPTSAAPAPTNTYRDRDNRDYVLR